MNMKEMLALAEKRGVSKKALKAALAAPTDAAADSRLAMLTRKRRTLIKLSWTQGAAIFLGVCAWALAGASESLTFENTVISIVCALGLAGLSAACIGAMWGDSLVNEMHFLTKVAGTDECVHGAQYLAESSWAREWRDVVLRERTELRVLDIRIIGDLATAQRVLQLVEERDTRIAQACKELHGIA